MTKYNFTGKRIAIYLLADKVYFFLPEVNYGFFWDEELRDEGKKEKNICPRSAVTRPKKIHFDILANLNHQ